MRVIYVPYGVEFPNILIKSFDHMHPRKQVEECFRHNGGDIFTSSAYVIEAFDALKEGGKKVDFWIFRGDNVEDLSWIYEDISTTSYELIDEMKSKNIFGDKDE